MAPTVRLFILMLVMAVLTVPVTGRPAVDRRLHHTASDGEQSAHLNASAHQHRPTLHVVVKPDVTTVDSQTRRIRITCTAASLAPSTEDSDSFEVLTSPDDLPYFTFYWVVMEHTLMPLTNNMPGITINHHYRHSSSLFADEDDDDYGEQSAWWTPKKRRRYGHRHSNDGSDSKQQRRHLANNDEKTPGVAVSELVIESDFYRVLWYGNNKLACKAYTLNGRRSTGFFIVKKV